MSSHADEKRVEAIIRTKGLFRPPCRLAGCYWRSAGEMRVPASRVLAPWSGAELVTSSSHLVVTVELDVETSRPEDAAVQVQVDRVRARLARQSLPAIVMWIPGPGARMRAVLAPYVPRVRALMEPWFNASLARYVDDVEGAGLIVEIEPQWDRTCYLRVTIGIDPVDIAHAMKDDARALVLGALPELEGMLIVGSSPYQ